MNDLMVIISFVVIVVYIAVAVKFWGMANNIIRIREEIKELKSKDNTVKIAKENADDAKVAYLMGEKEEAKRILDKLFYTDTYNFHAASYLSDFSSYEAIVGLYKPLYIAMELTPPNFEEYEDGI